MSNRKERGTSEDSREASLSKKARQESFSRQKSKKKRLFRDPGFVESRRARTQRRRERKPLGLFREFTSKGSKRSAKKD